MQPNVLILGGTTEARELATALAGRPFATTISLAGRTAAPAAQAVPVRVGGFGGATGLAEYLRANKVDFLIDATHPYAGTISTNAALAAAQTCTALLGLRRPPWQALAGEFGSMSQGRRVPCVHWAAARDACSSQSAVRS